MQERNDPTLQTEHEQEFAEVEEGGTGSTNAEEDPMLDEGRRPTADEDLAADQGLDDEESEGLG